MSQTSIYQQNIVCRTKAFIDADFDLLEQDFIEIKITF
jgi:hypothetical protein